MTNTPSILAIVGSASRSSSNLALIQHLQRNNPHWQFTIREDLSVLPHFDPEQTMATPPKEVTALRTAIEAASGVLISTPEYIFSIPARLKNMLEWCVATTVFSQKPLGIITASANGSKGHAELQLIMQTLDARFTSETCLLVHGIKGKINEDGVVTDPDLKENLENFSLAFDALLPGMNL
ncbi:MAG: NAD(P)H-dependent oxidoreductase [Niabella sp.]|nr:NAD(P)H-dependent oxidoreductase [Niabella sp.]